MNTRQRQQSSPRRASGDRFRISAALLRRLEDVGLEPARILRHAGLPAGLFARERVLVTTGELFSVYKAIAELSGDPGIGLKLGGEQRLERYDPVSIAAIHAQSFRDALERMARYKQLTCPEEIRVIERGTECRVQFHWLLADEPEPPLLIDLCFSWILAIGRRGTDRRLNPRSVELRRPEAERAMYEAHFGCRVKFASRQNVLVFERADVRSPFLTHNADLLALVAPQLELELSQQLAQRTFGDRVKGILKTLLAGHRPGLDEVAREMRTSTRTLQRRLTDDGATFQQLLEEARRELAQHYLLHSALELNETAYLLGYQDANSFFRAFQHWEGTTPGHWRAVHAETGPEPGALAGIR